MRSVTKKLDHVIFYNDGTFSILNVRASYPHLDKPFAYRGEGGDSTSPPKYQVKLLIPKTSEYTPSVLAIRDAINTALRQADIPSLPADRKCLKDGDLSEKPEEAGMYIFSASEEGAPKLLGNHVDPITRSWQVIPNDQAKQVFYGGCWVNCLVRLWIQNNRYGKRCNANLIGVQFVADDVAFGEGRINKDVVDDSFGPIPDSESGYADALADIPF